MPAIYFDIKDKLKQIFVITDKSTLKDQCIRFSGI